LDASAWKRVVQMELTPVAAAGPYRAQASARVGALGLILALLPLGLLVLWLLASLWLISEAQTGWAVFVMAWNGMLVGKLDNVLRLYLITSGISMRMVMVFLGVLGGLLVFGNVGVLLDPRQGLARFNSP
jgi:predicted PurR-regulated permease PerM